jgi:hypothetical protein
LLEATEVKVPLKKPGNSNNHDEGIIESLASAAASSTSNTAFSVPLTHKLGKHCPPKLQTAAPMLDCLGQAERVVWDQIYPCISRSPPPFTPRTLTADAELQLDPSSYGGVSLRYLSFLVHHYLQTTATLSLSLSLSSVQIPCDVCILQQA